MKRIQISALAVLGFVATFLQAPHVQAQCLNDDHYFEELSKQDPAAFERMQEAQEVWKISQDNPIQSKKKAVYRIPVVFHVVHQYGEENISKEQIEDQMRILNEDFRRLNNDASNTRAIFQGVAVDCEIEFVLAKRDPDGNCTEGINRIYSPLTNNARDNVKAVSYWPSDKYLNVWVVKTIKNSVDDPGVITLGYAQFPWDRSAKPTTDGIVLRADYVGSIGSASGNNNAGRTATHEIGHWFGLFHTFQGGCSTVSWGENINDTPPVSEPSSGCPTSANTCSNDNPDLPDQVENYMDYSNGTCQNMFSAGQKSRMQTMISAYRSVIISSSNATATGIDLTTASCVPVADLTNVSNPICEGSQVSFTNLTYNATVTKYTWTFEGGTPATSNTLNPTVTYNTAGAYKVSLKAENANGSTTIERDSMVMVYPAISQTGAPVQENFEVDNFPPLRWQNTLDGTFGWEQYKGAASVGNTSARVQITSSTVEGSTAQLSMEPLDMIAISDPILTFDLAYARSIAGSIDRLRVYASIDCGVTWVLIYQRAGIQMETGTTGTTNFVPTSDQWNQHSVNLKNYIGKRNLLLRFDAISEQGGNIYLDNINVGSMTSVEEFFNTTTSSIYPNPSANEATLTFETYDAGMLQIDVYDMSGKIVKQAYRNEAEAGIQQITIQTADLPNGVYMITTTLHGQKLVNKLVVAH